MSKNNYNNGELELKLTSFHAPVVNDDNDDFFDVKSKRYIAVVYEMAQHGDLDYTCEKTGIEFKDLIVLVDTEYFKKDLAKAQKEIETDGGSAIITKAKIYSHIMLDELKNIGSDKTQKASDRIKSAELILTMSGFLNKKEETKSSGQMVQINIRSSRGRESSLEIDGTNLILPKD